MPNLDEELQDRSDQDFQDVAQQPEVDEEEQQEEQRRMEAMANYQQQQRRQNQAQQSVQGAVNTVQTAQKWYKRYQKTVVVLQFLGATFPVWGTILLALFVIMGFVGGCNGSTEFRIASLGACEPFIVGTGGQSGGAGQTTTIPSGLLSVIPQQYVKPSAFGPAKFDYPKLNPNFANIVNQIMSQAQSQGLNVLVTSALRQPGGPEGYSCHYLGEAVDIDFQPAIPIGANQTPANAALIDKLLTIVRAAGPGFVQDEYRRPSRGATAGHVHLGLTSDPNCTGRQSEVAQYSGEYTMPY
jgi:hypothetical protein